MQAEGTDVLTGADGIRAGSLDVEATVPFEVVAAQIGPGTTITAAEDGQATVTRDVRALGRALEVQATGTVEVVRGRLVVEPRSVDVEGLSFLSSTLAAAARELVTIEQDVEGLPPGLVLREVTVTDDGFRARLDGEDVLVAP
ncbi:LmeA family phospholipid-binding protein [Aquipuribacter hungaricus]|uniref:LmeA family phospholipid-binding protein n=1 Tax=Aquipuribacter hungaricus TaxID=545624 RepID=UPI003615AC8D